MGEYKLSNITIKEIAQISGVSVGTVDRVLHNRGKVKKEKAELVLEICRREGYEPNLLARAMMMRKKNLRVAVIINNPGKNLFSEQVKDGLEAVLKEWKDYNVAFEYFYLYDKGAEEELEYLEQISRDETGYDGLIIKPVNDQRIGTQLADMQNNGMPIVTCTSNLDGFEPLCFVGQNLVKEGRMAANMLLKCIPDIHEVAILSIKKIIFARIQRSDSFTKYLKQARKDICVHKMIEYQETAEEVYAQTLETLQAYPKTEALYAHTRHLGAVHQAVLEQKREKDLVVFSFGSKEYLKEYIQAGKITFAIEETSYGHGYYAGREILNYLLTGKLPEEKNHYIPSNILIEESF